MGGYGAFIAAFTQNTVAAFAGYNINSRELSARNQAENLFTPLPPRPITVIETR